MQDVEDFTNGERICCLLIEKQANWEVYNMKRQVTEAEKAKLISKYRQPDGFVHCFVDNEKIDTEIEIHFDHIEPFVKVEETSLDNIAPVCRNHNL